jgi:hypothetical protein
MGETIVTTDEVDILLDNLEAWIAEYPAAELPYLRAREARARSLTPRQRTELGRILDARDPLLYLTRARLDLDVPEITDELADWLSATEPIWRPERAMEAVPS